MAFNTNQYQSSLCSSKLFADTLFSNKKAKLALNNLHNDLKEINNSAPLENFSA